MTSEKHVQIYHTDIINHVDQNTDNAFSHVLVSTGIPEPPGNIILPDHPHF